VFARERRLQTWREACQTRTVFVARAGHRRI